MDFILRTVTSLAPIIVTFAVLRYIHLQQIKRKNAEQLIDEPAVKRMGVAKCNACSSTNLLVHRGEYVCMNCENEDLVDW